MENHELFSSLLYILLISWIFRFNSSKGSLLNPLPFWRFWRLTEYRAACHTSLVDHFFRCTDFESLKRFMLTFQDFEFVSLFTLEKMDLQTHTDKDTATGMNTWWCNTSQCKYIGHAKAGTNARCWIEQIIKTSTCKAICSVTSSPSS